MWLFTGEDYALGPYNVTFIAGMTVVPLSIPILDDNIVEGDESFTLVFDSSVLPGNIFPDDENNQSTVVIVDDDCECVQKI